MADAAADLAGALLRRVDESGSAETRIGKVTVASPLTVAVGGAEMQLGRLSWYAPAVNDVVLILISSATSWTVLGKVLPP